MERVHSLYKRLTGHEPESIVPLSAAGSNRQYFRVQGRQVHPTLNPQLSTLIAVIGTNREENQAFVTWARVFKEAHLPVPEVFAVSEDEMVYLQEDLGDVSLYTFISEGRTNNGNYSKQEINAIRQAIRVLPQFQFLPVVYPKVAETFSCCYPQAEMDRTSVMFDLNYFKYCFLKLKEVEFNEYKLLHDFEALADDLLSDTDNTFLYRDFQSRNVMLKDGEPYFIDFQGGRRGPIYYDVASFLWQSSAKFSDALRNQLIDGYLDALQAFKPMSKADFLPKLHLFVLFRILQVLGAYGYRGLWEKKEYFINSIPLAIRNLQQELSLGTSDAYPYLKEVCLSLIAQNEQDEKSRAVEAEKKAKVATYLQNDKTYILSANTPNGLPSGGDFEGEMSKGQRGSSLVVRIFSFSFKKGIPADESGNGGGYVFDCRSTHNPGRYDEYKPLTGLDQPVIDFLEADGEILTFLDSVYKIVDFHVARFIERGFTNLQISFGCTGGRHRSVYSAQHVAEHIHQKFGVEVHICHREQNIEYSLTTN